VYIYARHAADSFLITALNLQPAPLDSYRVGVPDPGEYCVVLDTDEPEYGGSGYPVTPLGAEKLMAQPDPADGLDWSIRINLPPLGGLLITSVAAPVTVQVPGRNRNQKSRQVIWIKPGGNSVWHARTSSP
jgi:1,4-alpha-glucan branching enzyme